MSSPYFILEQGAGITVSNKDRAWILRHIRNMENFSHPHPRSTKIRRHALPYYEDRSLIELTNPRWGSESRLCFYEGDGKLVRLDGTSPNVHATNASGDLRITEATVLEYLAFFCFFVRGEEGPFLILDRLENRFVPDKVERDSLAKVFRSPRIFGQDENGDWHVSALVFYSNAIFVADFRVHLEGMIEMLDDMPVLADLEAKVNAPLDASLQLDS